MSSRRWRVLEESVEGAGEVALEAAGGLVAALPFAEAALDEVDGWSVHATSGEDDLVEGAVELSVAAAVEPVADRLSGGGRNRGGAREPGEGGFAHETALL